MADDRHDGNLKLDKIRQELKEVDTGVPFGMH
jgi:hypothetical protein